MRKNEWATFYQNKYVQRRVEALGSALWLWYCPSTHALTRGSDSSLCLAERNEQVECVEVWLGPGGWLTAGVSDGTAAMQDAKPQRSVTIWRMSRGPTSRETDEGSRLQSAVWCRGNIITTQLLPQLTSLLSSTSSGCSRFLPHSNTLINGLITVLSIQPGFPPHSQYSRYQLCHKLDQDFIPFNFNFNSWSACKRFIQPY